MASSQFQSVCICSVKNSNDTFQVTFKSTNNVKPEKDEEEEKEEEEEPEKETGFLEDIRKLLEVNLVEEGGRVIDNLWKSLPRLTIG